MNAEFRPWAIDHIDTPGEHIAERDDAVFAHATARGLTIMTPIVDIASQVFKMHPEESVLFMTRVVNMKSSQFSPQFDPMCGKYANDWTLRSDRSSNTMMTLAEVPWSRFHTVESRQVVVGPQMRVSYMDYIKDAPIDTFRIPDKDAFFLLAKHFLYERLFNKHGARIIGDIQALYEARSCDVNAIYANMDPFEQQISRKIAAGENGARAFDNAIGKVGMRWVCQRSMTLASDIFSDHLFTHNIPYASQFNGSSIVVDPSMYSVKPPTNSVATSPMRRLGCLLSQMNLLNHAHEGSPLFQAPELEMLMETPKVDESMRQFLFSKMDHAHSAIGKSRYV